MLMFRNRTFEIYLFFGLACSILCGCAGVLPQAQDPSKPTRIEQTGNLPGSATVAIMPAQVTSAGITGLTNAERTEHENMLATVIRSSAEMEFMKYGFQVVDRQKLDRILREQGLWMTGAFDDATTGKIGSLVGASHLLFIETYFYAQSAYYPRNIGGLVFYYKLIEVSTGKVVWTKRWEYERQSFTD